MDITKFLSRFLNSVALYLDYNSEQSFLKIFSDVLNISDAFLNTLGISASLNGRIKAFYSFFNKAFVKDKIFDIYAFQIVINDLNGHDIDDTFRSLIEVLREKGFTIFRVKNLKKPNGYRNRHFTIEDPTTGCFIECQFCTDKEYLVNCSNHDEFKAEKYSFLNVLSDFDSILKDTESFEMYISFYVPTFIFLDDNGNLTKFDPLTCLLSFHQDYFFGNINASEDFKNKRDRDLKKLYDFIEQHPGCVG